MSASPSSRTARALRAALALALTHCAAAPLAPTTARATLSVALVGGDDEVLRVRRQLVPSRDLPFNVQVRELPNTPATVLDTSSLEERLSEARRAYVNAEFDRCITLTARDDRWYAALRQGARALAARALLWRAACLWSAERRDEAAVQARALAVFEMELPEDAGQLAPEAESMLSSERVRAASAPRVPLAVRSAPASGLSVWIDGRDARCVTPCTLSVLPGTHDLTVRGPGYADATQQTDVTAPGSELSLTVQRGSAQLASQQWSALYAASRTRLDDPAALLLAQALGTDRLALLAAQPESHWLRLEAMLVERGHVRARTSRNIPASGTGGEGTDVLRELLVRGTLLQPSPGLWTRPEFWIALGAGVVTAAVVTGVASAPRPVHSVVVMGGQP